MYWILTLVSLIGVILNVRKCRHGFLLWMLTNFGWAIIDFKKGVPEQTVLFVFYFFLSLWGWVSWSKPQVKETI